VVCVGRSAYTAEEREPTDPAANASVLLGASGVAGVATFLGCAVLVLAFLLRLVREAASEPDGRLTAVKFARTVGPRVQAAAEPQHVGSVR
jgi:hypothetical protein